MARLMLVALLVVALGGWEADAQTSGERGVLRLEQRVALVIGNSDYRRIPDLINPRNDANAMARQLVQSGFTLVGDGPLLDLDKAGMEDAILRFGQMLLAGRAAPEGVVGLFYFAGHGVQSRNRNYLLPVSIDLQNEAGLSLQAVNASLVLEQFEASGTRLAMLVLDACRNNPFPGSEFRNTQAGLTQMQAAAGTLIGFAAQPGGMAADAPGEANSPYTAALIETMRTPGLNVLDVFNEVGLAVARRTNNMQQPWVSSSPIDGRFSFTRAAAVPQAAAQPAAPAPAAPAAPSGSAIELAFWQSIQNSQNPAEFEAYLAQFPNGTFAALARNRIAAARERVAAVPVVPPQPARMPRPIVPVVGVYPQPQAAFRDRRADGSDCPECPEMIVIPPGVFPMGVSDAEETREGVPAQIRGRARPQRDMRIGRTFALGRYEVTVREYAAFATATARQHAGGCNVYRQNATTRNWEWQLDRSADWRAPGFAQTEFQPVVCVNWEDAQAYMRWLSEQTMQEYRLASEAEWEYAARAGAPTARWWGDRAQDACTNANVVDRTLARALGWAQTAQEIHLCDDSVVHTSVVGRYRANDFGLHDMLGNVWEWVEDCWNANYVGRPIDDRAWIAGDCSQHVTRGGGWISNPWSVRSGSRSRIGARDRYFFTGLRAARRIGP